jgi:hypothetical protein
MLIFIRRCSKPFMLTYCGDITGTKERKAEKLLYREEKLSMKKTMIRINLFGFIFLTSDEDIKELHKEIIREGTILRRSESAICNYNHYLDIFRARRMGDDHEFSMQLVNEHKKHQSEIEYTKLKLKESEDIFYRLKKEYIKRYKNTKIYRIDNDRLKPHNEVLKKLKGKKGD